MVGLTGGRTCSFKGRKLGTAGRSFNGVLALNDKC